jgi:hypothetical protein
MYTNYSDENRVNSFRALPNNRSKYLKNVYPSGFGYKSKVDTDIRLQKTLEFVGQSKTYEVHSTNNRSMVSWTKGKTASEERFQSVEDPFSEVAGPYFRVSASGSTQVTGLRDRRKRREFRKCQSPPKALIATKVQIYDHKMVS